MADTAYFRRRDVCELFGLERADVDRLIRSKTLKVSAWSNHGAPLFDRAAIVEFGRAFLSRGGAEQDKGPR